MKNRTWYVDEKSSPVLYRRMVVIPREWEGERERCDGTMWFLGPQAPHGEKEKSN